MKKLSLLILLLIPSQAFAGALYNFSSSSLRATDRRVESSTAAARRSDDFSQSSGTTGGVYTLDSNYHEASYIRAQQEKEQLYIKVEKERLAKIAELQKEKERELQMLERELLARANEQRKLQELRAITYANLPESQNIAIGDKNAESPITRTSSGGPAGRWVRKVLFDWNS